MKNILTLPSGRVFRMDFLERVVFVDVVRDIKDGEGIYVNFPWTIHYFVKAASSSEYLDTLEINANSEVDATRDRDIFVEACFGDLMESTEIIIPKGVELI